MARFALALVWMLASARAFACPPQVHAGALGETWQRAVEALRDELAERGDVDRCAELDVDAEGGAVRVTVWFADGRHATRAVANPASLRPAVLALVLVAAPPAGIEPAPWSVTPPVVPRPAGPAAIAARTAAVTAPAHGLAAVVAIGERWTATDRGASALAGLHAVRGTWSAGLVADYARAVEDGGLAATSLELGAELGRRLDVGIPVAIAVGPHVAWLGQDLVGSPPMPVSGDGKPNDGTRSSLMLRIGGGIAAQLVANDAFSLGLAVRASGDVTSDVANRGTGYITPTLPEWSFELALAGEVRLWP